MKVKVAKAKKQGIELERGPSHFEIDCKDNTQTTSLMKASSNGHIRIVELLVRYGADARVTNARGESALTLACLQENFAICQRLIVAKADVNQVDP